jgi:hypothetical protein
LKGSAIVVNILPIIKTIVIVKCLFYLPFFLRVTTCWSFLKRHYRGANKY